MNRTMQRLSSLPNATVLVLALGLLGVIGYVDYVTGRDLYLSAFYLLPISWVAWAAGRLGGIIMATLSAAAWLAADLAWGYEYHQTLLPYWNASMLLVLFVVVVYWLTAFHRTFESLQDIVQQRTAALQALAGEIKHRKRLEA